MKASITILLLSLSFSIFAQKDSSYYNPNIARKIFYLKPLQKIGGNYFYGERKLRGFYALEVPFYELNDAEVNHHYQQFKTFTGIGSAISIIPTMYLLATINNSRQRQSGFYTNNFIIVSFASLGGSVIFNLIAKSHIKKAAIKYNQAIGKNNLGYLQLKTDENSLGMSVKYHF
jgi:hypothetical protein